MMVKGLKELGHHINSKCTIYITIQATAPTILLIGSNLRKLLPYMVKTKWQCY